MVALCQGVRWFDGSSLMITLLMTSPPPWQAPPPGKSHCDYATLPPLIQHWPGGPGPAVALLRVLEAGWRARHEPVCW
uniref:Uncharacterized protein n=1 Tax=Setaria viridis TaxID=4556 RepID=A0A4V6D3X7_SETVI|nr:hypothetical protein SEVIR_7G101550v2 [Setaria viridis]